MDCKEIIEFCKSSGYSEFVAYIIIYYNIENYKQADIHEEKINNHRWKVIINLKIYKVFDECIWELIWYERIKQIKEQAEKEIPDKFFDYINWNDYLEDNELPDLSDVYDFDTDDISEKYYGRYFVKLLSLS
jgi:hypothetical protein